MKIKYIQPSYNEEIEEVIVTIQEAIRLQKEHVSRVRPDFTYQSDDEALQDYMAIHWAWVVE